MRPESLATNGENRMSKMARIWLAIVGSTIVIAMITIAVITAIGSNGNSGIKVPASQNDRNVVILERDISNYYHDIYHESNFNITNVKTKCHNDGDNQFTCDTTWNNLPALGSNSSGSGEQYISVDSDGAGWSFYGQD
jgi:hypothetical protein